MGASAATRVLSFESDAAERHYLCVASLQRLRDPRAAICTGRVHVSLRCALDSGTARLSLLPRSANWRTIFLTRHRLPLRSVAARELMHSWFCAACASAQDEPWQSARTWWRGIGVMCVSLRIDSPDPPWSSNVREFRDLAGTEWSVFRATPHTSPSKRERILPETFRFGWLVFECERERRRLAPVPEGWETLTDRELERLCALANVVPARAPRRTTTPSGSPAPAVQSGAGDARESGSVTQTTPVQAAELQALLAKEIQEVCEQPHAQSLDTGELIRVEETLTMAADAARAAVALRRASRSRSR